MDTVDLKAVVESLLLAAGEPLPLTKIAEILEVEKAGLRQILEELTLEYVAQGRGFRLEEIAGGYQLRTPLEHAEWVRRLNRSRPFKFSRAALETLAIVAYRQPLTRGDIEYLRGVDSGGVLRTLLEKHLVRILGKKDVPGRPIIYGTSPQFLEMFGLNSLSQLPPLKEVGALADTSLEPMLVEEGMGSLPSDPS